MNRNKHQTLPKDLNSKKQFGTKKNLKRNHFSEEEKIYIMNQLLDNIDKQEIVVNWDFDTEPLVKSYIYRLIHKVRMNGTMEETKVKGRKATVVTPENMMKIEIELENDDTLSCRDLKHILSISKSSVHVYLKAMELNSYKFEQMQKLSVVDCENRIFFCERFIRLYYET